MSDDLQVQALYLKAGTDSYDSLKAADSGSTSEEDKLNYFVVVLVPIVSVILIMIIMAVVLRCCMKRKIIDGKNKWVCRKEKMNCTCCYRKKSSAIKPPPNKDGHSRVNNMSIADLSTVTHSS